MENDLSGKLLLQLQDFNATDNIDHLIKAFSIIDPLDNKRLNKINEFIDIDKLNKHKFILLSFRSEYLVYVESNSKIVAIDYELTSILNLLNDIREYQTVKFDKTIHSLKTALLIAGRGKIKSYDVFTNSDSSYIFLEGGSLTLSDPYLWTEDRQVIHKQILSEYLKYVRELSDEIKKSEKLTKGLFCTRGMPCSGKSSYIKKFLLQNGITETSIKGIINTDIIKNFLIKYTENIIGSNLISYVFHDEASMLCKKLLKVAQQENLLYVMDNRSAKSEDLDKILCDAQERNLSLTIFDVKADFINIAIRTLNRSGIYPSEPVADFKALYKNYKVIEEHQQEFINFSLNNASIKEFRKISTNDGESIEVVLKENFIKTKQGEINLIYENPLIEEEETIAVMSLPKGGTLQNEINQHADHIYGQNISKENYLAKLLLNIKNTSRTFNGELDLTSSSDKKIRLTLI